MFFKLTFLQGTRSYFFEQLKGILAAALNVRQMIIKIKDVDGPFMKIYNPHPTLLLEGFIYIKRKISISREVLFQRTQSQFSAPISSHW